MPTTVTKFPSCAWGAANAFAGPGRETNDAISWSLCSAGHVLNSSVKTCVIFVFCELGQLGGTTLRIFHSASRPETLNPAKPVGHPSFGAAGNIVIPC